MDKIKLKEDHGTHNNPLLTLLWTHSIILVSKSTLISLDQPTDKPNVAKRLKGLADNVGHSVPSRKATLLDGCDKEASLGDN